MEYLGKGLATMAIWLAIGYYGRYWGFFAVLLGIGGVYATVAIWTGKV